MTTAAELQIAVHTSGVTSATSELAALTNQGQRTERATDGLGKQFTKLAAGATAAAAAVAAATIAFVRSSAKQVKEMQELARVANTGYEAFQGFAYATEKFGFSAADLADVSKDVQDKIGDFIATGGGEFADFFENVAPKVGLTAQALQGLSGPDALIAVKKAMDDANISAEEQVFYLESLGNNVSKLTPLLEKNGEEFRRLAAEGRKLGGVLTEIESQSLLEAAAASSKFDTALSGLGKRLAVELAPAVTEATETATAAISRMTSSLASGEFEEYLGILTDKFDLFADDINNAASGSTSFISSIFGDLAESMGLDIGEAKKAIIFAIKTLPEHVKYYIQRMGIEVAAFVEYGKIYGAAFSDAIVSSLDNLVVKAGVYGKELADKMNPFDGDTFDFNKHLKAIDQKAASDLQGIFDKAKAQAEKNRKLRLDMLGELEKELDYNVQSGLAKIDQRIEAARNKYLNYTKELENAPTAKQPNIQYGKPSATAAVSKEAQKEAERLAKIREQEFSTLQDYLKTEEQAILDSYQNRLRIIEENTANNPEQREELKGKLDQKYATEALDGFINESDTFEAKAAKIEEEFQQRRDLVLSNTALTEQMRTELETQLTNERNTQLADLENKKNQQMMQSSSQLFDGLAGIAKSFAGEQSGAYKALFAVSKAFSIAQATMSIATGLGKAQELGFPANLAEMARVTAAGASIMSTIQGSNFSGAYDKGGHIPAGKFGLVGEYGPEFVNGPANVTSRKDTTKMLEQATNQKAEAAPAAPPVVKIINNVDPAILGDFLDTHEGEQLIMNVVRRNQGALS
ncbi:hypothetical protein H0A36_24100 [Endozoicomonas sp. SM1973]|uniref:Tail tape measure protein n=1 Tax=Spartinivicinus marinus TaxID=2994442 RepID=A0A853II72_9GAMM|nr:hypothetical protein [Spartinivicinus marinus]NYZ69107.1 hypothetical protein [Spartinivicinus marinus]